MSFEPKRFIEQYQYAAKDEYHSQYQFDYIYKHMRAQMASREPVETLKSALWLSSFLAHWGMFRGRCEIRNKNFLFFRALTQRALGGRRPALTPLFGVPFQHLTQVPEVDIDNSFRLMQEWLAQQGVSGTPLLISKMVLGLLGNTPAYDRYFLLGLRQLARDGEYEGPKSFSGRGLHALSQWAAKYEWPRIRCAADARRYLPRARLVDMAVYQYGQNLRQH